MVAPQDVIAQSGADILRLWVAATDYVEDQRIGKEILKYQMDVYRRLRNTLRYLLGALEGFTEAERVEPAAMPELERWVLHRLAELDALVRKTAEEFDFHTMFTALHNFCAVDLSAFYFDVRKDALYCDRPDRAAPPRRAHRARSGLRLPRALARAGALLHRRGGLARCGTATRRDSSVHLQRSSATCRRRGATMRSPPNGPSCAICAASSPARIELERAQAPRRQPAGASSMSWHRPIMSAALAGR